MRSGAIASPPRENLFLPLFNQFYEEYSLGAWEKAKETRVKI